jgi:uncharacterized membrane protein (GlpM family)
MLSLFLKCLLGALAVLAIALLTVYALSLRCTLTTTLLSATASWALAATLLMLTWSRLHPAG